MFKLFVEYGINKKKLNIYANKYYKPIKLYYGNKDEYINNRGRES